MIHDVVLHINNEQPLRADLFELPEGDTMLLRCTNVRTMNGTRPVYIDDLNSIIFFPMIHLRFIEILPATQGAERLALGPGEERVPVEAGIAKDSPEEDLQIDEDFLRRVRDA
ncbi:MAG TPA: hypothetical protein VLB31_07915 [Actinomycetota bacterium]|nr:hypothetical protein [Actinomycetota bacterium]